MEEALKTNEMEEIINDFIAEANELIENSIQETLIIEKNFDDERINSIFRSVHTLKGTSSFLGFNSLTALAHRTEDLLGKIRKKEVVPDTQHINIILESLDLMKFLIEDIKEKGKEDRDTGYMIERLDYFINLKEGGGKKIGEILLEEEVLLPKDLDVILEKQKQEPHKKIGEIIVDEKLLTEEQMKEFLSQQKTKTKDEQSLRIDVKKLDELMDLVGELVLGKNRLIMTKNILQQNSKKDEGADNINEVISYIESITNELQVSVMKTRLVPISKLFNKVPRMVRDLSREFNKEVELKIEGGETELDRSIVEALHDPLIHIVRNSIDHGIEDPEIREKMGKKRSGLLSIKAYNEGNHVIVEITDDGRGIDIQALKEKVRDKNLIGEKEFQNISDKDAVNLIFIPGLSTAKKISNISGRGVGMDVVKTKIEKMNGHVHVEFEKNRWTKIVIRLALTLAIMKALIVRVFNNIFAIPLHSVIELVKAEDTIIKEVDKKEVILLRNKIIPLVDKDHPFFIRNTENKGYIVICNMGENTIGLKVDAVLGQEEVVIKPLGEFLKNIKGISGATIRGDGRIILILDLNTLFAFHNVETIKSQLGNVLAM